MGRSASEIKDFILARIAAKPALSDFAANTNDNALYKQFVECIANVMATHHTVADNHIAAIEDIITGANSHTHRWIIARALEFQYDETVPQVLTTVDGVIQYETIDETKRIIKYCAVNTTGSREATLSVAKGDPLGVLSDLEIDAFETYMNSILNTSLNLAGVIYLVSSLDPDYCYIKAEVRYDGLYSSTIKTNVTNAIEGYLQNLGTFGKLAPHLLREAVKSVTGVKDFIIEDLAIRANGTAFASKTYLVQTFVDQALVSVATTAGYAYTEVESGYELSAKLTYTNV